MIRTLSLDETPLMVTLVQVPPPSILLFINGEIPNLSPYLSQFGKVLKQKEPDVDHPTGYEPTYYYVEFQTVKAWIPVALYQGRDEAGNEVWNVFLK
jgi:hypothetical protein